MLPLDTNLVQAVPRQQGAAVAARIGLQLGQIPALHRLARDYGRLVLPSLKPKLIKIGARVVRLARAITFQLAEVAVTGAVVRAIITGIRRLRAPPSCA